MPMNNVELLGLTKCSDSIFMTSPLKGKQCHSHAMNAMLAHMLTIFTVQYFTY